MRAGIALRRLDARPRACGTRCWTARAVLDGPAADLRCEEATVAARRCARTIVMLAWGFGVALPTSGCTFGPKVLELSHGRYNEAVRREQLLRHLVHMRYNEPPLDLNVSSIAAQYELDGGVEARPFFQVPNPPVRTFRQFTSVLPDINVSGANRPTLTLIPSDNGKRSRSS